MPRRDFPHYGAQAGGFSAAALVLSIPFSTSVTLLATIALALCWLATASWQSLPEQWHTHPALRCLILLFGLFVLGLCQPTVPWREALHMLDKYRELLLPVLLWPFWQPPRYRHWALMAFVAASLATLLGSYVKALWFAVTLPDDLTAMTEPTFKNRITHNLLVAFLAFYALQRLLDAPRQRIAWAVVLGLSLYNIFFMVTGRTGQILVLLLIVWFAIRRLSPRRALYTIVLVGVGFAAYLSSPHATRMLEGITQTQHYFNAHPETQTSMGQRLTFWRHSLTLFAERPLLGHGTGGFAAAYQRIAGAEALATHNPHNEYLMIAVQLGLPGLLLFLASLVYLYREAQRHAPGQRCLGEGVVLALTFNSLVNSSWLDHTESHWFAAMITLWIFTPTTPLAGPHSCALGISKIWGRTHSAKDQGDLTCK